MNPSYDYILPSGIQIFRASTISKEGKWYNLSLEDSYVYGETITEYSTTRDLKLLNIASLTFHNDFIDRLNVLYPDTEKVSEDKIKCLVSLGLIDIYSQLMGGKFLNLNLPISEKNWDSVQEYSSKNLMNRHRLSDHTLDAHLVSVIQKIYGHTYEGIISPFKWPTKIHGGNFPRELCLFKIENIKEEKTHKRQQVGGSIQSVHAKMVPLNLKVDTEHFNKIMDEHSRLVKENPITLFWNPHTEDTYTKPSRLLNKKNLTRKNRNNTK